MYLDSAYIARYYIRERESDAVQELVDNARIVHSSGWAMQEGSAMAHAVAAMSRIFLDHADGGLWNLIPVRDPPLRRSGSIVASSPPGLFLRAGDAVHLTTAKEPGEKEVSTNRRHMLAAAPHFGLTGRSIT